MHESTTRSGPTFYDRHFKSAIKRWPAEPVVSFFERNREELIGKSILDVGCGTGRHSIFMASRGARVSGIDSSTEGISLAREWAAGERLEIEFEVADKERLPYADGSFDAVVSWGAAFYGNEDDFDRGLSEAFRVLKPDGWFLLELKSQQDYQFTQRRRIGPCSVLSAHEMAITCCTREQIVERFQARSEGLGIEWHGMTMEDGAKLISNFIVHGRKRAHE